jgi:hypothetical protein
MFHRALILLTLTSLFTFQIQAQPAIDYDGGDVKVLKVYPHPDLYMGYFPSISSVGEMDPQAPAGVTPQGVRHIISVLLKSSAFYDKTFKGIGFYVNRGSFDAVHTVYPPNDGNNQVGYLVSKRDFRFAGPRVLKDGTLAIEFLFTDFYHFVPGGTWFSPSSYMKPYALFNDGTRLYRIWDSNGSDYFLTTTTRFDRTTELISPDETRAIGPTVFDVCQRFMVR